MAGLVIHSQKVNKNSYKSLIAAEYVGVKVEMVSDFQMGVTNKSPEFLKMNPIGKVPVLQTPEGPIFESNAMARYVANMKDVGLVGSSAYEKALVEQWIDFATMEIDVNAGGWVYPRLGFGIFNEEVEAFKISNLKRALTCLNAHLASRTYLVGESITLADIVLICNMIVLVKLAATKEFTSEFPHVERYFWTLVNQPNFKKILGEVSQATQPLGPPPAQDAKPAAAVTAAPKESAPKQKKEKAAPAPKPASAPAPAPAPESVDDEEAAPVKKAKNSLDLLPPSPMVLDNWKRLYSNTKAKDFHLAISGFWEMFDAEGYSLWFCDYKYNDENQVTFVTMNKVGGFLQRMDLMRKYAFGKMCILGEEAPYKIKGVWLFRGLEMPQMVLDEVYDAELYDWTKVDINNEEQKALVNAYFEEPDTIQGEKLLEAKCFK
jgi:elongation factor 1-gamma